MAVKVLYMRPWLGATEKAKVSFSMEQHVFSIFIHYRERQRYKKYTFYMPVSQNLLRQAPNGLFLTNI
jgi:hypothetical protein